MPLFTLSTHVRRMCESHRVLRQKSTFVPFDLGRNAIERRALALAISQSIFFTLIVYVSTIIRRTRAADGGSGEVCPHIRVLDGK
jgi:hypothetical protein